MTNKDACNNEKTGFDEETVKPTRTLSFLPEITEELKAMHQSEKDDIARRGDEDSETAVCGIPRHLLGVFLALLFGVIIGTLILVIYYDPNDSDLTKNGSPTTSPTMP
jgi:hypothetical protein